MFTDYCITFFVEIFFCNYSKTLWLGIERIGYMISVSLVFNIVFYNTSIRNIFHPFHTSDIELTGTLSIYDSQFPCSRRQHILKVHRVKLLFTMPSNLCIQIAYFSVICWMNLMHLISKDLLLNTILNSKYPNTKCTMAVHKENLLHLLFQLRN